MKPGAADQLVLCQLLELEIPHLGERAEQIFVHSITVKYLHQSTDLKPNWRENLNNLHTCNDLLFNLVTATSPLQLLVPPEEVRR